MSPIFIHRTLRIALRYIDKLSLEKPKGSRYWDSSVFDSRSDDILSVHATNIALDASTQVVSATIPSSNLGYRERYKNNTFKDSGSRFDIYPVIQEISIVCSQSAKVAN